MDVRQLTAGSSLYLPIECAGAQFSVGDAHGVQGDGEVCLTAVEMDSTTTLRFTLRDAVIAEPQLRIPGPPTRIEGPYHGCTAHAKDVVQAAKNATRYLIEWLGYDGGSVGLAAADFVVGFAFVVCGVVVWERARRRPVASIRRRSPRRRRT